MRRVAVFVAMGFVSMLRQARGQDDLLSQLALVEAFGNRRSFSRP